VPQCDPWHHHDGMSTDSARQGAAASRRSLEPWSERFFASADGLRLHYRDYAARQGGSARLPVLCLAGLTRNSRDFERLAPHLQRDRRVLAADLRGRGRSARDPNWRNYQPSVYLADLRALLDDAHAARVVIVGTSLGGLLAMMLAALEPARVAGIVLNDIGPEIDPAGRTRITTYVGRSPPVANWDAAIRQSRATYGIALPGLSDADWLVLARRCYTERDGVPELDMDPMIGESVRHPPPGSPENLWPVFAALESVPMLALRGELSDVLSAATLERMRREHGSLEALTIADRGHPPLLDEPAALAAIDGFLSRLP
jgi:pimeloyl-ACP methyl ester carboxylesterase